MFCEIHIIDIKDYKSCWYILSFNVTKSCNRTLFICCISLILNSFYMVYKQVIALYCLFAFEFNCLLFKMKSLSESDSLYFEGTRLLFYFIRGFLVLSVLYLCVHLYLKRKNVRNAMNKLPGPKTRIYNLFGDMILLFNYYLFKYPAPFHACK